MKQTQSTKFLFIFMRLIDESVIKNTLFQMNYPTTSQVIIGHRVTHKEATLLYYYSHMN